MEYIRRRLNERSTWILFATAITVASALPWPWSVFSCVVGVIGAMIPDGPVK